MHTEARQRSEIVTAERDGREQGGMVAERDGREQGGMVAERGCNTLAIQKKPPLPSSKRCQAPPAPPFTPPPLPPMYLRFSVCLTLCCLPPTHHPVCLAPCHPQPTHPSAVCLNPCPLTPLPSVPCPLSPAPHTHIVSCPLPPPHTHTPVPRTLSTAPLPYTSRPPLAYPTPPYKGIQSGTPPPPCTMPSS